MTSVKLTKAIREDITIKVLRHRFSEQYINMIAERATFTESIYLDCYSKEQLKLMNSLPVGWLPKDDDIAVKFAENYQRLQFNGYFGSSVLRQILPYNFRTSLVPKVHLFPAHHRSICIKVYEATHALSIKFFELETKKRDFELQVSSARTQTESVLSSVTTIKRLKEIWPEVSSFCSMWEDGGGPVNLPSLPIEKLNQLLNLPVKQEATA